MEKEFNLSEKIKKGYFVRSNDFEELLTPDDVKHFIILCDELDELFIQSRISYTEWMLKKRKLAGKELTGGGEE